MLLPIQILAALFASAKETELRKLYFEESEAYSSNPAFH
jgi:hypothetical protein